MKILQFLEKERIPKILINPPNDHNNFNLDEIKKYNQVKRSASHVSIYWKYTNYYLIDNDEIDKQINELQPELYELLKNCPFIISRNKKRHNYIFKMMDCPKYINDQNVFNDFKGDLLHPKCNTWLGIDAEIYNYNDSIPELSFKDLKKFLKLNKMNLVDHNNFNTQQLTTSSQTNTINDIIKYKGYQSGIDKGDIIIYKKNDSYCENIKDHHKNNSNYLIEYKNTNRLELRCYCKCENKSCKDYVKVLNEGKGRVRVDDDDKINTILCCALSKTHSDVAELVLYYTKDKFVCSEINKKSYVFYEFKNHKWNKYENFVPLINFIDNEIIPRLKNTSKNLIKIESSNDTNELKLSGQITKLIISLKNNSFVENVIMKLATKIYDDKFENKLDDNNSLLCFNNGIYDLEKNKFRDGLPSDYCSISCGYDFIKVDPSKKMISTFKECFHNDEDFNCLMTFLASCLEGINKQEMMMYLLGTSRNGKGLLKNQACLSFGDYCRPLSLDYLTKESKSPNSPNPELISLKGCRLVIVDEPDGSQDSKIISKKIKSMTGNDQIKARKCFSNMEIIYTPKFTPLFLTNGNPNFTVVDDAIINRLYTLEFPYVFCEKPNLQHEKQINPELKDLLPSWKNDFMNLLIDYYFNTYKKNGFKASNNAEKYKKEIVSQIDTFASFISDTIEESKDGKIKVSDLFNLFKKYEKYSNESKTWFSRKLKISGFKLSDKVEVQRSYILGYKFISNQDIELEN